MFQTNAGGRVGETSYSASQFKRVAGAVAQEPKLRESFISSCLLDEITQEEDEECLDQDQSPLPPPDNLDRNLTTTNIHECGIQREFPTHGLQSDEEIVEESFRTPLLNTSEKFQDIQARVGSPGQSLSGFVEQHNLQASSQSSQPICFVRVDQDYFLQLLQNQNAVSQNQREAMSFASDPLLNDRGQQSQFVNYKDSKQNGFQAALFLTPPKINSGSINSTPSPNNAAFLIGHIPQQSTFAQVSQQPVHHQPHNQQQFHQYSMMLGEQNNSNSGPRHHSNGPTSHIQERIDQQKLIQIQEQQQRRSPQNMDPRGLRLQTHYGGGSSQQQQIPTQCYYTSPQQHPISGTIQVEERELFASGNKALLMGYGGIFLGRDLLSLLESSSSSAGSSPPGSNTKSSRAVSTANHQQKAPSPGPPTPPTVNNIIINNYNGNILQQQPQGLGSSQIRDCQQQTQQFQMMIFDDKIHDFDTNSSASQSSLLNIAQFKREHSAPVQEQTQRHEVAVQQNDNTQVPLNSNGGVRYRKKTPVVEGHPHSKNSTATYIQKSSQANQTTSTTESATNAQNTAFNFPDGGWVCSQCQNYNFYGRVKCNRCQKVKTKQDFNGKPKHLLKKTAVDLLADAQQHQQNESFAQQNQLNSGQVIDSQYQHSRQQQQNQQNQSSIPSVMDEIEGLSQMQLSNKENLNYHNVSNQFGQVFQQRNNVALADTQAGDQVKKPLTERVGDWVCVNCKNLNFSFRKVCNRCQITRQQGTGKLNLPASFNGQQFIPSAPAVLGDTFTSTNAVFIPTAQPQHKVISGENDSVGPHGLTFHENNSLFFTPSNGSNRGNNNMSYGIHVSNTSNGSVGLGSGTNTSNEAYQRSSNISQSSSFIPNSSSYSSMMMIPQTSVAGYQEMIKQHAFPVQSRFLATNNNAQ